MAEGPGISELFLGSKDDHVKSVCNILKFGQDVFKEFCPAPVSFDATFLEEFFHNTELLKKSCSNIFSAKNAPKYHQKTHYFKYVHSCYPKYPMERKEQKRELLPPFKSSRSASTPSSLSSSSSSSSSSFLHHPNSITASSPKSVFPLSSHQSILKGNRASWRTTKESKSKKTVTLTVVNEDLKTQRQLNVVEEVGSSKMVCSKDMECLQQKQEYSQKPKWNKKYCSLLAPIFLKEQFLEVKADDSLRTEEFQEKQEIVNESALNIHVKPSEDTEAKSLKHILNPHLRQTVLHPTNPFQVELLSGCPLEHRQSEIIARQSQSVYKKHLQVIYPISSKLWSETEENKWEDNEIETVLQKQISTSDNQIKGGFLRWVALPEVIEPMISRERKNGNIEDTERQHSNGCTKNVKEFPTSKILAFWDENWYIKEAGSTKSNIEEEVILLDMIDLHPSVRCSAIFKAASIGMQYLVSVPHENGEDVKCVPQGPHGATHTKCLPDNILEALQCVLADPNEDVKLSAALSLFCLHQGNEKAADILRVILYSSSLLKRWVAAYCLGYFHLWNSDIINELIKQIFMMPKSEKMMQGIQLLVRLSEETDLVQLLLAEYLSSNSCHEKQMACNILSKLRSQMKKDISGKLLDLFWMEWNADIKMLAAYCLGCNNQGKRFHDDLLSKLDCSDYSIRRKALWIIGRFRIMTRKILVKFLLCFQDPNISIRVETCMASCRLKIAEPSIMKQLIAVASQDPIWKIRKLAIEALSHIGVWNEPVKACLLSARHDVSHHAVRAQACRSLALFSEKFPEAATLLQEHFLSESDPMIKSEWRHIMSEVSPAMKKLAEVEQMKSETRSPPPSNNPNPYILPEPEGKKLLCSGTIPAKFVHQKIIAAKQSSKPFCSKNNSSFLPKLKLKIKTC